MGGRWQADLCTTSRTLFSGLGKCFENDFLQGGEIDRGFVAEAEATFSVIDGGVFLNIRGDLFFRAGIDRDMVLLVSGCDETGRRLVGGHPVFHGASDVRKSVHDHGIDFQQSFGPGWRERGVVGLEGMFHHGIIRLDYSGGNEIVRLV